MTFLVITCILHYIYEKCKCIYITFLIDYSSDLALEDTIVSRIDFGTSS